MPHRILVVEDETDVRENVEEILTNAGYLVETAATGIQAIAKMLKSLPDLIISDIMMPELNGYELLEFVQESKNLSHIPFIFLSARTAAQHIRNGMTKGADDYLTKPFKVNELLEIVRIRLKKVERLNEKLHEIKENIALSVPHELRTPLTPILGYSGMMIDNADTFTQDDIVDMGKKINSSALRLRTSIEKFILYSSIHYELNNLQNCSTSINTTEDVESTIHKAALEDANYSNNVVGLETNIQVGRVNIPESYFFICVKELLQNAFKFSEPQSKVIVTGTIEDKFYSTMITNKGVAITNDQIRKISLFNKQYDPTLPGSGLGIPIVKKIVNHFGGNLSISSDNKDTTKIIIQFPI